jgi:hypothetical protein
MSHSLKAGLLFAFAAAALPPAANAVPVAGPSAQGTSARSPIVKADCYDDCCYDCCNDCGWRPRWRDWGPRYWRPRQWPGYYYHNRWRSHYRWGSYHRLWDPYDGGYGYGGGWD